MPPHSRTLSRSTAPARYRDDHSLAVLPSCRESALLSFPSTDGDENQPGPLPSPCTCRTCSRVTFFDFDHHRPPAMAIPVRANDDALMELVSPERALPLQLRA